MTEKTKPEKPTREVKAMMAVIAGRSDLEVAEIATHVAPNADPELRLISGDVTKEVALAIAAVRQLAGR